MDVAARRVEVEIECRGTVWVDPQSRQRAHIHGYEKRRWRHLDTMQFETVLVAQVPRVKYPDGRTEGVSVPWADRYTRFTKLFEAWAVTVLKSCATLSDGCVLLDLSWASAQSIMRRAVERGMQRRDVEPIARVGLDEKSFGKGQDYISVLSDIDGGRVIEVAAGRDQKSACMLLEKVPLAQRQGIEAVAMDMSAGFKAAVEAVIPRADIVYDRFHVSKLLNGAVDEVRRRENKELLSRGDESLKATRYSWLFNPVNMSDQRLEEFTVLAARNLRTSRAWLHKENFEGFWSQDSVWRGEGYLKAWYNSAIRSRLDPIKKTARTLKAHTCGLLNYFRHRISNAVAEGLNSKIQSLKAAARGFRNFAHYRIRILFFCGKLDLSPSNP